ncbi:MAG: Fic family protein [Kiritimatiellia bacterium]
MTSKPLHTPSASVTHPFGGREGLSLEFKEARDALPRNTFETICAFLNLDGGLLVLGVADDGIVSGIDPNAVDRIRTDIANLSNNPGKLEPPYLLFPRAEQVDGKWIIKVQVPASSQVHRTGGEVFLRSEEGDYRLKDPYQIAGLVNRKVSFYTEQRVLPWLGMPMLRSDLFARARELFRMQRHDHPWLKLTDEELLRIGGFIRQDPLSGQTGYSLAAALMFGSDETIQQAASGMTFDALFRRVNVDRYDDRLLLHTNLIDTFDLLMGFVEKHLNDPFHLEGTERISLRERIFRELISNLIAHREYTSAAPATMTIHRDRVVFRNPHVPHIRGRLDPAHFTPFPKNPTICRFMLQLGRYEQIGSGVYNVSKYVPIYSHGGKPQFDEQADLFVTTIPLTPDAARTTGEAGARQGTEQDAEQDTEQVAEQVRKVLETLKTDTLTGNEIMNGLGMAHRPTFLYKYMQPAVQAGLIEMTIPDKPNSRLQKYRLTDKGRAWLVSAKR